MAEELDTLELKEFLTLVDSFIDGIENGSIKKNPLAPLSEIPHIDSINEKEIEVTEAVAAIKESELLQEEVKVERVVDVVVEAPSIEKDQKIRVLERVEVIGKLMNKDRVLIVSDEEGNDLYFGNNGSAASALGVTSATAKRRATKNFVDDDKNTWFYETVTINE